MKILIEALPAQDVRFHVILSHGVEFGKEKYVAIAYERVPTIADLADLINLHADRLIREAA